MAINPVSFKADAGQNSTLNNVNEFYDSVVYTKKIDPDDLNAMKFAKGLHNVMSLEKVDGLEDKDLMRAQLHNTTAVVLNPLLIVPYVGENIKGVNTQLNAAKAKEVYQQ